MRAGHQLADEGGLPAAPRGGAGGRGVGLGERVQQVQHLGAADEVRHGLGGRRVGEVAPGRDVGQQQVVPDQRDEDRDVVRGQPEPRPGHRDQVGPDGAVVARPALADVVQQGGEQQQVGAGDPPGQPGRGRRGLGEVPVDGEAVHGVALRLRPHALPLRQQPDEQPGVVERLQRRYGARAGGEQSDQRVQRRAGPGLGQRRAPRGEQVEGGRGARQARPGGGLRDAQRQDGVEVGPGPAGEHRLAGVLHDVVGQRAAHRRPAAQEPAARPGRAGAAPGGVGRVRDRAPGRGHRGEQRVGVGVPEGGGDAVLLLQQQPVPGPAPGRGGAPVQLAPHVEQHLVRLPYGRARSVRDLSDRERVQRVHVAQPAAGLLEVGLEQERHLAERPSPLAGRLGQLVEPGGRAGPPGRPGRRQQPGAQVPVAGDVPRVEQAEGGLEVAAGDRDGLVHGAHGVVQVQPAVPERVPEGVGDRRDVRAPGVDEQEVEVAARGHLAAAQPPTATSAMPGPGSPSSAASSSSYASTRAARRAGPARSARASRSARRRRRCVDGGRPAGGAGLRALPPRAPPYAPGRPRRPARSTPCRRRSSRCTPPARPRR